MAELIPEIIPGPEVRKVVWPAERYFVETGDFIIDITKFDYALSSENNGCQT